MEEEWEKRERAEQLRMELAEKEQEQRLKDDEERSRQFVQKRLAERDKLFAYVKELKTRKGLTIVEPADQSQKGQDSLAIDAAIVAPTESGDFSDEGDSSDEDGALDAYSNVQDKEVEESDKGKKDAFVAQRIQERKKLFAFASGLRRRKKQQREREERQERDRVYAAKRLAERDRLFAFAANLKRQKQHQQTQQADGEIEEHHSPRTNNNNEINEYVRRRLAEKRKLIAFAQELKDRKAAASQKMQEEAAAAKSAASSADFSQYDHNDEDSPLRVATPITYNNNLSFDDEEEDEESEWDLRRRKEEEYVKRRMYERERLFSFAAMLKQRKARLKRKQKEAAFVCKRLAERDKLFAFARLIKQRKRQATTLKSKDEETAPQHHDRDIPKKYEGSLRGENETVEEYVARRTAERDKLYAYARWLQEHKQHQSNTNNTNNNEKNKKQEQTQDKQTEPTPLTKSPKAATKKFEGELRGDGETDEEYVTRRTEERDKLYAYAEKLQDLKHRSGSAGVEIGPLKTEIKARSQRLYDFANTVSEGKILCSPTTLKREEAEEQEEKVEAGNLPTEKEQLLKYRAEKMKELGELATEIKKEVGEFSYRRLTSPRQTSSDQDSALNKFAAAEGHKIQSSVSSLWASQLEKKSLVPTRGANSGRRKRIVDLDDTEPSEKDTNRVLPYSVLVTRPKDLGLDFGHLEGYLSPQEFESVFKMDWKAWAKLPFWMQRQEKLKVKLW
eukprot:TRINITY_DN2958_c0_g1_i1.p1 TRINITY_DN2958_c0_g1~~TRINITY_DN2958_c0_g1_i1.p1  ORF type:complete len:853 (+),score=264.68 TRINITY_DN2958_c0_g1_i1:365-2560(+)